MIRKRSEELHLIDSQGNPTPDTKRSESRCDDITFSDQDQSPSRSTNTTESQVTVRSSPLVPETESVCWQCNKTCISNDTISNRNYENNHCRNNNATNKWSNDKDDWRSLLLMGLTAINPVATLVKLDPFAALVSKISVLLPTPELQTIIIQNEFIPEDTNCKCKHNRPHMAELILNKDYDNTPDDSLINDQQLYHSLNSSNLTLRIFGTVSSLERFGSDKRDESAYDANEGSIGSDVIAEESELDKEDEREVLGVDNEAFNNSSILSLILYNFLVKRHL